MSIELMRKHLFDPSKPFFFGEVTKVILDDTQPHKKDSVVIITQPVESARAMSHQYGHTLAELIQLERTVRSLPPSETKDKNLAHAKTAVVELKAVMSGRKNAASDYSAASPGARVYTLEADEPALTYNS